MSRTLKGGRTLPCDNTVADGLRVKWNSGGYLTVCGATDEAVGIVDGVPLANPSYASGYMCTIISPNTEDGVKMIAAGSIGQGVPVYAAAAGKISATGTLEVGVNWTPSAVAGTWCDVQPLRNANRGSTSTVAATGSTQTDAAALNPGFNLVTGANATKGVVLPAGQDNMEVTVKNADAANAVLNVYPSGTQTINALAASTAIAMAAKTSATFRYSAGFGGWFTVPLLPS